MIPYPAVVWLILGGAPLIFAGTPGHEELALGLKHRSTVFTSGVLEARETLWDCTPAKAVEVEAAATVLSTTMVSPEKAAEFAAKFEGGLLDILGPGAQRAWAWFGSPVGTKLLEVPLEPGEKPGQPVKSATKGNRWTGFQDGITARFDEDRKVMLLDRGKSDSVFRFRPSDMDPTLQNFTLFNALKHSERGFFITPSGNGGFRVSMKDAGNSTRFFFFAGDDTLLLVRRELMDSGNLLQSRGFFGSYGQIAGGATDPGSGVPYSTLEIMYDNAPKIRVRLLTVTRWTAREVPAAELEIKLPKGTQIVRDGME